jgi:hypothetical protein
LKEESIKIGEVISRDVAIACGFVCSEIGLDIERFRVKK